MSPVKYELGIYISEDDIHRSLLRKTSNLTTRICFWKLTNTLFLPQRIRTTDLSFSDS
jgi:hypothetical protein